MLDRRAMTKSWMLLLVVAAGCAHSDLHPARSGASAIRELTVTTPAGDPARSAVVVVAPAGQTAVIENATSVEPDPACPSYTANAAGRVRVTLPTPPFLIAVVHPDGYAQFSDASLPTSGHVRLRDWARIHGEARVGDEPAPGVEVYAWNVDQDDGGGPDANALYDPDRPHIAHSLTTRTDEHGRFTLDRVPPTRIMIGRSVSFDVVRGTAGGVTQKQSVALAPGESRDVHIGGAGRRVVGHVMLPPGLASREDWVFGICSAGVVTDITAPPVPEDVRRLPLDEQQAWYKRFTSTPEGRAFRSAQWQARLNEQMYPLEIARDGSFHIDDVPDGAYTLYVDLLAKPRVAVGHEGDAHLEWNAKSYRPGERMLTAEAAFEVRTTSSNRAADAPVIVADVKLAPFQPAPRVGDLAPDFSVPSLSGATELALSDFRGRVVLLDFWATWCGSCVIEMPNLKALRDSYDDRIAIISLSSDEYSFEPNRYVETHGLTWMHGFIGPRSEVSRAYGVTGIPSIWLIGADGRVLAKAHRAEAVRAAVEQALRRQDAGR